MVRTRLAACAAATVLAVFCLMPSALAGTAPSGASGRIAVAPRLTCDGRWHRVKSADHTHLSGEIDSLNAVDALSPTDGWAAGSWTKYPESYVFHTYVQRFDGTRWRAVDSPNTEALNNYLYGIDAVTADDVWAVGGTDQSGPPYATLVEHWDGRSWTIVPEASVTGVLYAVAEPAPNDVWAVGTTDYPGHGLIEHWDGTSWTTTVLDPDALLRGIAAVSASDIWTVGQRYNPQDPFGDFTFTMHYDGIGWSHVRSPSPLQKHTEDQNWLTSVTAVATDDVWAVGRTGDHDWGILDQTLVEHWDGGRWRVVRSPDPGGVGEDDILWGVAAIGSDDVWAVGSYGNGDPYLNPLAEHWNGLAWGAVPAPGIGQLLGVSAEPGGTGLAATGDTTGSPTYVGTLAEHLCPG